VRNDKCLPATLVNAVDARKPCANGTSRWRCQTRPGLLAVEPTVRLVRTPGNLTFMGMKMHKDHVLVFESRGVRITKEFDNEVARNRYVDQVVLPVYRFEKMPPVVMKIGKLLFVGDDYPEAVNDSDYQGNGNV